MTRVQYAKQLLKLAIAGSNISHFPKYEVLMANKPLSRSEYDHATKILQRHGLGGFKRESYDVYFAKAARAAKPVDYTKMSPKEFYDAYKKLKLEFEQYKREHPPTDREPSEPDDLTSKMAVKMGIDRSNGERVNKLINGRLYMGVRKDFKGGR